MEKVDLDLPCNLQFDITEELLLLFYEEKLTSRDLLPFLARYEKFKNRIEGFLFELEYLPTITNDRLREDLLKNFHDQIVHNFIRVQEREDYPAIKDALKEMIFSTLPGISVFGENLAMMQLIFRIQAHLVIFFYKERSEEDSNIISIICECSATHQLIYGFINFLSANIRIRPSVISFNYPEIIEQMALDGSQSVLLAIVADGIAAGELAAIESLSSLMEWVDVNILNEYSCLQKIKELLENDASITGAFMCLISFFGRANEKSELVEVIRSFDLHTKMLKYIQAETSKSAEMDIVARLLSKMLANLMTDDIALEFFDIAEAILESICLNCWNSPRNETFGFILSLISAHNEIAVGVADLGRRICDHVVTSMPSDYDQRFREGIKLIKIGTRFCKGQFAVLDPIMDMVTCIAQSDNYQQKAIVLSGIALEEQTSDVKEIICTTFDNLLSVEEEEIVNKKETLEALTGYISIVTELCHTEDEGNIEKAIELSRRCFITTIHSLLASGQINTSLGYNTIKALSALIERHPQEITSILTERGKIGEVLLSILQYNNDAVLALASDIINYAPPEEKIQLVPAIVGKLLDAYGERDTKTFVQDIKFVGRINCSDLPEELFECFESYFGGVIDRASYAASRDNKEKNDYNEAFASFIIGSSKILKAASFKFYIEKIGQLEKPVDEIFAAIAEAALNLNLAEEEDSALIPQILDILIPKVMAFDEVRNERDYYHQSQREFITMTSLFLINIFDGIEEEIKEKVFNFITTAVMSYEQSAEVICPIVEFLIAHTESAVGLLAKKYESFNALINIIDSLYSFNDEDFTQSILRFLSLHEKLIHYDPSYKKILEESIKNPIIRNSYISLITSKDSEIARNQKIGNLMQLLMEERKKANDDFDGAIDEP